MIWMSSCKKWEDHTVVTPSQLNETLMEHINKEPALSTFAGYVVKTGLDSLLNASRSFTVFAPDNQALAGLSPAIVADNAQLKGFLLNLISEKTYFTREQSDSLRVPMLNGKRVFFSNNHLADAELTQSDIFVKNGVLHVIDKAVEPLPSVWEYIETSKDNYEQNAYVASLNYKVQDPALAELDSINPMTSEPVYKPGTGIVTINTYRTKVYDVGNEDSLYTYIVLDNSTFRAEKNNMAPYFAARSADTTDANAAWSVTKDLTVKGLYTTKQLPALMLSRFGVHVAVNASTIVETKMLSNGIAYIVKAAPSTISEKIPVVYVQGEMPLDFSTTDAKTLAKVFYRQRTNIETGQPFSDIYANLGSSGANFYIRYATNELYATKYKVYWVALNDRVVSGQGDDAYGSDSTLSQIVRINPAGYPDSTVFAVAADVLPDTYTEMYIGEYTNTDYNWLLSYPASTPDGKSYLLNPATKYIKLQAPASVTTGKPYNIMLDYLKFVPVL